MPFCIKCGHKIEDDDDFCPDCGAKTKHKDEHKASKEKSKKAKKKKSRSETYTCPHCDEDFEVDDLSKKDIQEGFTTECDHCGEAVEIEGEDDEEEYITSKKPKVVHREYHHYSKPGMGGFAKFLIFIVILGIIGFILFLFLAESGALDDIGQGSGISTIDPCEKEFNQCNRACGEGWLAGACKEKCSYDYRNCRS